MPKKMQNSGVIVTVEDSQVDFMIRAGYVIIPDEPEKVSTEPEGFEEDDPAEETSVKKSKKKGG